MRRPFRGGGFGGMSLAGGEQRCGEAHADDSCQTAIPAIRPIRLYTHHNPAPATSADVADASSFSLSVARAQEQVRLYMRDRRNYAKEQKMHEYRSEEHTSELQSLMSTSYAAFCLKKK